jgi:hypothetical protein
MLIAFRHPGTDTLLTLGFILDEPIEKILVFQTIEQTEPQDNSFGSDHLEH